MWNKTRSFIDNPKSYGISSRAVIHASMWFLKKQNKISCTNHSKNKEYNIIYEIPNEIEQVTHGAAFIIIFSKNY